MTINLRMVAASLLLGCAGLLAPGFAQPQDRAAHDHGGAAAARDGGADGSTEAYRAANDAMHAAMDIEFTGDADVDYARGMIGHHQGAIEMSRIVLEHGDDPELRRLAEEVIEAQEAEIGFLREWLARRE